MEEVNRLVFIAQYITTLRPINIEVNPFLYLSKLKFALSSFKLLRAFLLIMFKVILGKTNSFYKNDKI